MTAVKNQDLPVGVFPRGRAVAAGREGPCLWLVL